MQRKAQRSRDYDVILAIGLTVGKDIIDVTELVKEATYGWIWGNVGFVSSLAITPDNLRESGILK